MILVKEQKTMLLETLSNYYKLLGHSSLGETEFRVISVAGDVLARKFISNEQQFISISQELITKYSTENIFVGVNPRDPKDRSKIAYLTTLFIDVDPIRSKGAKSTDEQHNLAISICNKISSDLPNSVVIDSGSGAHTYLPIVEIKVEDAKALTASCKEWSDAIIQKYTTEGVKFDSVFDLPRVARLPGSFNPKSNRTVRPVSFQAGQKSISNNPATFPRTLRTFSQRGDERRGTPEITFTPSRQRFEQLIKLNPHIQRIINGEGEFKSPSERNFAFVSTLVKAHFGINEIKEVAIEYYPKMGSEKTETSIDADVERIANKIYAEGTESKSLLSEGIKYIKSLENRKLGLTTGISSLDAKLGGLQPSKTYVLAARTNEGKTSFACSLAYHVVKSGIPVLYFPTELGHEPLFDKIVAQTTEINLKKFQLGNFTVEERERIDAKMKELAQYPFIVHEDFGLTAKTVAKVSKEICPGMIIIDFIQAMKYEDDMRAAQIENNIRAFKELNEQLNIPILIISQLSRAAINNELNLSQLKGSGAIEEYADCVLALSTKSKTVYPRKMTLHILKSRYSEIGDLHLDFYSSIGKFEEAGND